MNTYSPLEHAESLRIGTVDFISPDEIKVALDIEAPESVSLNTGSPRPFPRVNGYVLVPCDGGHLVGQIEWLAIERSPYPKRKGMHDFGLIDLPYPLRKMSLNSVGILIAEAGAKDQVSFRLSRGVNSFPSVGTPVLLPTQQQLKAIIESGEGRRVKIGASPLADNATVSVNPDRLFGRHLAVLGNTGSGKSCSVAGIIRWSLEAARKNSKKPENINARFIVLDPNGEYSRAFKSSSDSSSDVSARIFKMDAGDSIEKLQVPLWFWNSTEWNSFTRASGGSQRPLLKRALREVRAGHIASIEHAEEESIRFRRYVSSCYIQIKNDRDTGVMKKEESKFGYRLKAYKEDFEHRGRKFPEYKEYINPIVEKIKSTLGKSYKNFFDKEKGEEVEYYRAFIENDIDEILSCVSDLLKKLGGLIYQEGPSEDTPIPFIGLDLADHLEILSQQENVTQYLDSLIMRIRTMLSDTRIKLVTENKSVTLDQWLNNYVGNSDRSENITVLDLSLVPSEVIHIIVAVVARVTFEALQRYRKLNDQILPTVLVMEEAHTFIKRYKDDAENQDTASVCCQVFEKIAREGRKFGLGLVVSSQRPSELSPTVLSQCNTFLLHRISNDRDQDLVKRFVPDSLKGLLRELPSLPSQQAILMGWASELPLLVRVSNLPKEQQPQSDDPDFWDVWTREKARSVNWKEIADDWQERGHPSYKSTPAVDNSTISDSQKDKTLEEE